MLPLPSAVPGASIPSGVWVAAMMMPPPARWSRITAANRSCPAVSSAEVGSSSSQTGRRTTSRRAIDSRRRWPADRYAAGRCVGVAEADGAEALAGVVRLRRRENRARTSGFRARSAPASARRDGRDSGLAPASVSSARRPPARPIRRPARSRPAISRSSEVLPEPLGPTTASASPGRGVEIEAGEHRAAAPDTVDAGAPRAASCAFTAL